MGRRPAKVLARESIAGASTPFRVYSRTRPDERVRDYVGWGEQSAEPTLEVFHQSHCDQVHTMLVT